MALVNWKKRSEKKTKRHREVRPSRQQGEGEACVGVERFELKHL